MKKGYYILILMITLFAGSSLLADAPPKTHNVKAQYAANEVLVKLKPEAAAKTMVPQGLYAKANNFGINELDQILLQRGGSQILRAHRKVKDQAWADQVGWDNWFIITLDGRSSVETVISSLMQNRYVEKALPHYIFNSTAVPNDPLNGPNWGHNNTGTNGPGSGTAGFDARAYLAWDLPQGYGNPNIIIAIIDTGVDTNHEDLRLVAGYDYGDNDSNPMDDSAKAGHGTSCAGIAAAIANNAKGVSGIAGGCSVMPLKVANSAGDMYFTAVDNALTHAADNGAHIISLSLGAEDTEQGQIPATDNALTYAYNKGLVIFAATGNENSSVVSYPANHEKVIAVGAASPSGQRKSLNSSDGQDWWGSNYGVNTQDNRRAVDIMGPTILPTTKQGSGSGGFGTPSNQYTTGFNGTSCATPYVAGVAALLLSMDNSLSPAEVRASLINNTTDMTIDGGTGWDRYTGYGMVNAYLALSSLGTPAPLNLSAVPEMGKITLYWDAPDQAILHYNIYRDSVFLQSTTGTIFTDEHVNNEQIYYYEVSSVDAQGESIKIGITVQAGISLEVILGTDSSNSGTTNGSPINAYYKSLHGQSVYTKAELNAAGIFGPIRLSELGFNVTAVSSLALPNFIVRLKHTTATNVASWQNATNLETLYSVSSYSPTAGWDMLKLDTEFIWNGEDNILVDTAFGVLSSYESQGQVRVSSQSSGYRFVRSDNANQSTVFSGGSVLSTRPNLKMVFRPIIIEPDPELTLSVNAIDFGEIMVGGSASASFEISNTGGGTLEILPTDIQILGADAAEFELKWPSGGISLAAEEVLELYVEFSPLALGAKNAVLHILDQELSLLGIGISSAIVNLPYTENFDEVISPALPAGWTVVNANNDDRTWFTRAQYYKSAPNCLAIQTNQNTDDYAFSPAIEFEAGQTYKLDFYYRSGASRYPEKMKVFLANSPAVAGLSTELLSMPTVENATYALATINFSVESSGTYYLAWYCHSEAPSNHLMVDNLRLDVIYDFPEDETVALDIGSEIVQVTVAGGPANSASGIAIPEVINASYNEIYSFVMQLFGSGPWDIEFETNAAFAAYYQGGWHEATNDGGYIRFTGIQSAKSGMYLPITLGENSPTLPVELSSFNAVLTADMSVKIAWVSESETNHAGYNILRSDFGDLANSVQLNRHLITEGSQNGGQTSYQYTDNETYLNAVYHYWLCSVGLNGEISYFGPLVVQIKDSGETELPVIPLQTKLHAAFPNPFNPATNLRYSLKEAGIVKIGIYNLKGQLIKSFEREHGDAGYYQIAWDGRDENGRQQSTGVYFYRMQSGDYSATKKMIMSK